MFHTLNDKRYVEEYVQVIYNCHDTKEKIQTIMFVTENRGELSQLYQGSSVTLSATVVTLTLLMLSSILSLLTTTESLYFEV